MKKNSNVWLLLLIAVFLSSCSKDDETIENPTLPEGEYTNGFFVLNEGGFTYSNASLSFISEEGTVYNAVFSAENNRNLGDVAQSMGFHEDLAYILINNSNTIEVVNRYTMESVTTLEEGILNPRYIIFDDNFAYVTNWGDPADITDDYIAVINLENYEVVQKIEVAEGPEKLVKKNGKIYVAHKGGWGYGNTISVINTATNSLQTSIEVNDVPDGLVVKGDFLYVLCSGKANWTGEETNASLFKINLASQMVEEELQFPVGTHPGFLEENNNTLHYVVERDVFEVDLATFSLPTSALFSTQAQDISVLYGFTIHNDVIYIADAEDYSSNGEIFTYSLDGELINNYSVQLVPNGFYFNN
ncbi:hypothetical protein RBU60_09360 [Mesonia sp. MT50]|uniref:Cell surface protein n=1 Tax=Mesonia profundi TaxID=3070998 RepID=A0ABU1A249_9FLAO|nr:DUF5074 domain-containing protein [Mesonia profundi]MDQ7917782.1 hypothetical protein [Mesonia profundi]